MPVPAGVYTSTCESHHLVGKNGCLYVEIRARVKGTYTKGVRMASDENPFSVGTKKFLYSYTLLVNEDECLQRVRNDPNYVGEVD